MKTIKYRYQYSHFAILIGLLGMLLNASWGALLILNIIVAFFFVLELSHNLFMIFGTPIIISGEKMIKRNWFLRKSILIGEETKFSYHKLLGLSFGKEILIIKTGEKKMRIFDNYVVNVREFPDLLRSCKYE